MIILDDISQLALARNGRKSSITIGNFDGCHIGHQALFQHILGQSAEKGLIPIVVTFDPHPAEVLGKSVVIPKVQPLEDRLAFMRAAGIEIAYILRFSNDIASLSANAFVRRLLVEAAGCQVLAVGDDFRFGSGRSGDIQLLKQLGAQWGFEVRGVSSVLSGNQVVSSTRIRSQISELSDFEGAAKCLGRSWELIGSIIAGQRLGRTLGFPTANLETGTMLRPANGVYAAWVRLQAEEIRRPAVMNVGTRPTIGGRAQQIEVHLLAGWSGDLYGQALRVAPVARLREEQKFASKDELRAQIARDCVAAIEVLNPR